VWALEPVLKLWRRKKSPTPAGTLTKMPPPPSNLQPMYYAIHMY